MPPKKKTVEEIFVKKTQLEHIIDLPDTYIGSVENTDLDTFNRLHPLLPLGCPTCSGIPTYTRYILSRGSTIKTLSEGVFDGTASNLTLGRSFNGYTDQ